MAASRIIGGLVAAAAIGAAVAQSQVHISMTGEAGEMGFDWAMNATCAPDIGVSLGASPDKLDTFLPASSCFYFLGAGYLNQARATGLAAGTRYFYRVGSAAAGYSPIFNFTMLDLPNAADVHTVAVLADFGLNNSLSLPKLISEAADGRFDFVIHAGDFAYDMDEYGNRVGSAFMNQIQPVAAHVPYMGCAGNHEVGSNFSNYRNRFAAIANWTAPNSGSFSNHWYSYEVGLVHYIMIDSEVYDEFQGQDMINNMLAWLKKDLASVDRSRTPWVVANGHKAHYMSGNKTNANMAAWETLFYDGGVDLYFCGHVHSYDRFAPWNPYTNEYNTSSLSNNATLYTDPSETITIVSGAPGCREVVVAGCRYDEHNTNMAHCGNYGYGYFTAVNATHAHWRWETAVANGDDPADWADDAWVVQHNHGPRKH